MFFLLLKSLYFFLPAYLSNMVPVLVRKIPLLGAPMHNKLLGPHKTWRGLISGTLVGGIVFFLQQYAYVRGFTSLSLIDYAGFPFWFGFLQGFGALFGDAVKSYYKRKSKITPGKLWFPGDQLDFVFGAILVGGFIYFPPAETMLVLLVASPLLHVLVNYAGYLLHVKETKW